MKSHIYVNCIILLCLFSAGIFADDSPVDSAIQLDGVIVTSSRTPATYTDLVRSVVVLTRDDITAAPVHSVNELLTHVLSVDIRSRAPHGVQSDVSIRGGNSEQTLILIDGVKVCDPQTAHHNLDLPISLSEIERIEVLKGSGSRLYGPNAITGVINIITSGVSETSARLETVVGDFGLLERQLSAGLQNGALSQTFNISRRNSTGYRDDTEYNINAYSYNASYQSKAGPLRASARYIDKQFGAYKFYSETFPDEFEATKTTFLSGSADLLVGNVTLSPKIYWRRHDDDFILDRNRPDWYRNLHTTDHYGLELQNTFTSHFGITAIGSELGREEIESGNLGNHHRNRGGVFAEHRLLVGKATFVPGISMYSYSDWGWQFMPGLDLGYQVESSLRLYASLGKSFRVPSFTDLYYVSPANLGNPDLEPEISTSFETGATWRHSIITIDGTLFARRIDKQIDWTRQTVNEPWQVINITEVTVRGIETGVVVKLIEAWSTSPMTSVHARYTYLDSDRDTGSFESKYALDHLKHQLIIDINHRLPFGLTQTWNCRYLKRLNSDDYLIVDTRLNWSYKTLGLFAEVSNLFDTAYIDVGTIPHPGRWFSFGLNFSPSL